MNEQNFGISSRFVNNMTIHKGWTLERIKEINPSRLFQPLFVYEINLISHETLSIFIVFSLQDIEKIKFLK